MFNKIAILHFKEANAPSSDDALEHNIVIRTDLESDELDALITAIANVKEHADEDESISDFDVPDNWDSYGWDEKIDIVCEHMAEFTGRFETMIADMAAYADVN